MFNLRDLAGAERDSARLLGISISSLRFQVIKFSQALALADFCDGARAQYREIIDGGSGPARHQAIVMNQRFVEWIRLAVEAGAIVIYNFAELIQTIDGLIGQVPVAKEHMHRKVIKAGRMAFYDAFPDYSDIRFAVAHAGKPFASPQINEQQRIPGAGAMIIGMLEGRTLSSTVNGKAVSYSLTSDALDALERSAELIDQAFWPVRQIAARRAASNQSKKDLPG